MISPRDRVLGLRSGIAGRAQCARGRQHRHRIAGVSGTLAAVLAAAATWTTLGTGVAEAVPIDDPHIGGIGFSGPTTGDLASVYWNPAALSLMHGQNMFFSGVGRLTTTTVSRASIDPVTGIGFPEVRASDRSHPFIWPPGPGAFAGIATDVGGDRFALAFATYMPFVERTTYQAPPTLPLPTRYHRISADLRNLAMVPALAVRFAGDFRLGFAPGFLFSTGRMSFDESTCATAGCVEDPAGDAQADLGSGQGLGSAKFAVTLGAGLYFRVRSWEFGFSYASPPLGGDVSGSAVIGGDASRIYLPATATAPAGPLTCPPYGHTTNGIADGGECVYANIVYKLPTTWIAAATWHPRPGWELAAIARILSFASDDAVDIRLTGMGLTAAGIPQHIVLYRGYGTVVDTRLRISRWISEGFRVGAGLRVEGSALPDRAISPAAVDGRKLEPTVMALFRPIKHLWIGAGYGFTYMFPVTSSTSVFQPDASHTCTQAGGDLSNPGCMARNQGTARPTTAGTYRRTEHAFSLSVSTQF